MKMKKLLALLLSAAMVLGLLAACGGNSKNSGENSSGGNAGNAAPAGDAGDAGDAQAGGEKSAADVKIVLLLPGEINDQGWNASNYAGVVACNEQLGTSMEYVEAVQEARSAAARPVRRGRRHRGRQLPQYPLHGGQRLQL